MNIWCLFSADNNYDQPANNLVCWWREKPDIQTLANLMGVKLDTDAHIIAVVRVHQGEKARLIDTDYRLEQVAEGVEP
jgi:hypothetical protein